MRTVRRRTTQPQGDKLRGAQFLARVVDATMIEVGGLKARGLSAILVTVMLAYIAA